MPGDALGKREQVVREISERRGARQQRDIVVSRERRNGFGEPGLRRLAVDRGVACGEQRSAELCLFVAEQHPRAGFSGRERCGKSGRPAAHDQHVAMRVTARITIRIGPRRCASKPCHRSDTRLIDAAPRRLRPHEGLVVEARGYERRDEIVHGGKIERERGPAVLAFSHEPIVEFDLRRQQVRRAARPIAHDSDKSIGLVDAGCHDAARPVILEGTPDKVHAIGDEGGCKSIAGESLIGAAVKLKSQPLAAIDAAAVRQAVCGHRRCPLASTREVRPLIIELVRHHEEIADRVADCVEEAATAVDMSPALDVQALGIGAVVEIVRPFAVRERRWRDGAWDMRLPAMAEFDLGSLAAERASDQQHANPQCATAAAAASSISTPSRKRSSENGALIGCGRSFAMVSANTWPEPGVALKPPVPQPQFT